VPKFGSEDYLPVEMYIEALDAFHLVSGIILFEYARQELDIRETIIRNFIARADTMARAVFRLWEIQDYQDCWILHRCLMDRLFHITHLDDHNQFEVFEEWSFFEQYKATERVMSDPGFKDSSESKVIRLTEKDKERAKLIYKNPSVWRRPKAEEVAKKLDMPFLYRYGYDYGSTHVHPMAADGFRDFFTITKLTGEIEFPDERSVLSNTLLVATMIVQGGLNASGRDWHLYIYDFIDNFRRFLGVGLTDYRLNVLNIVQLVNQKKPLCKLRDSSNSKK
jgi:hypothetical protein